MSHGDELDQKRAKRFLWTRMDPGEAIRMVDPEPETTDKDASNKKNTNWQKAYDKAAVLAGIVDRVWAMADAAQQAAATANLVRRAKTMGFPLGAVEHFPLQSIRLARLAIRHLDRLPADSVEDAYEAAMGVNGSHPEISELILDVIRSGDRRLEFRLMMSVEDDESLPVPHLAERLATILDEGPNWNARLVALHFVRRTSDPVIVPALRRALRLPCISVRWWALRCLNQQFSHAIQAEDVLFMLEDAVVHPLPDDMRSEEVDRGLCYYPEELQKAIMRLRPPGGDAWLVRIINGDCATLGGRRREGIDETWALSVLTASYPECAIPWIDRRLGDPRATKRQKAVEAMVHLPPEQARPRLTRAAADGAPDVAERARDLWFTLFHEVCPVDDLAGLDLHLLDAAPSERFKSRLLALRGSLEARYAMLEVLMGEAPDAEALVLLIFALADDQLLHIRTRPGLPTTQNDWCEQIVLRFGERGVRGLCALAERYPEESWGWLRNLDLLVDRKLIPATCHDVLRALANHRFARPDPELAVLSLLDHLGAPLETHPRLLAMALDPNAEPWKAYCAASAVAHWSNDPQLDARVIAEMQAGLDTGDFVRMARAAQIGFRRDNNAEVIALALRALEQEAWKEQHDPAVVKALSACVDGLREASRLPDGWAIQALARPDTSAFTMAAQWRAREATTEMCVALRKALTSKARQGAAAAEAATALVRMRALSPRSRRLPAICNAAPLLARAKLMRQILFQKVPLASFWPALEELLTCADNLVTEPLQNCISQLPWKRQRSRLIAMVPRIVDSEIRHTFNLFLHLPSQQEDYWQDPVDKRRWPTK